MNILALDLGTSCGWAMKSEGKITSGVWDLKPSKFDSHGVRFLKFRRHLELELVIGSIQKVYYEAVRHHIGIDAAQMYGGYVSQVQLICHEYDLPYEGIPVQTIKKHATGSGNADKKMMIEAAIKKFKTVNIINDDHADGLHLLDLVTSSTAYTRN